MPFTSKKIKFDTLGSFLKEARLAHGWELEEVERSIGVSKKNLRLIEDDEYYKLPGSTYTRGMLSRYGEFLGLDPISILERWKKEFPEAELGSKRDRKLPLSGLKKSPLTVLVNPRAIVISLVILLVLTYFGFGIKRTLFLPEIKIIAPEDNLVTDELFLRVEGNASPGAEVFINNSPVSEVKEGYFSESIVLAPGLNNLKISAKKKHSPERVIWRSVIARPKEGED